MCVRCDEILSEALLYNTFLYVVVVVAIPSACTCVDNVRRRAHTRVCINGTTWRTRRCCTYTTRLRFVCGQNIDFRRTLFARKGPGEKIDRVRDQTCTNLLVAGPSRTPDARHVARTRSSPTGLCSGITRRACGLYRDPRPPYGVDRVPPRVYTVLRVLL